MPHPPFSHCSCPIFARIFPARSPCGKPAARPPFLPPSLPPSRASQIYCASILAAIPMPGTLHLLPCACDPRLVSTLPRCQAHHTCTRVLIRKAVTRDCGKLIFDCAAADRAQANNDLAEYAAEVRPWVSLDMWPACIRRATINYSLSVATRMEMHIPRLSPCACPVFG